MLPEERHPMRRSVTTGDNDVIVVQDLTTTENTIVVTLQPNIQIDTGDTFYDTEEDDLNA